MAVCGSSIGLALLALATVGGCRTPANAEKHKPTPVASVSDASVSQPAPRKVRRIAFSLIELIANPRQYQGTDVSVQGYLVVDKVHDDEDDATLYLERESARMNITTNAVSVRFGACPDRVSISDEQMIAADSGLLPSLPGYVVLKGTFDPAPEGALSRGARICAVTSLIGLEDPEQGSGADSWWNSVRPVRERPPGTAGRGSPK